MGNRSRGFTLLELMIVMIIVGMLSAIAYPSYMNQMARSRRNVAKADLMELQQWMERNYTITNDYTKTYDSTGAVKTIDNTKLPFKTSPRSGTKYYDIDFSAGPAASSYTLKATAVTSQAAHDPACKDLTLRNDGKQDITGTGTASDCWNR